MAGCKISDGNGSDYMEMEKEIRHIVEYQNSILPSGQRKGPQELDSLIQKIIEDYQNNN